MTNTFASHRGAALIGCVGAGIAVVVAIVWHWPHLPVILPYAIILLCPLMHLFMHRGHSTHNHSDRTGPPTT